MIIHFRSNFVLLLDCDKSNFVAHGSTPFVTSGPIGKKFTAAFTGARLSFSSHRCQNVKYTADYGEKNLLSNMHALISAYSAKTQRAISILNAHLKTLFVSFPRYKN